LRSSSAPIQQPERQLAAVVAADIAGYSRLMGADEEGTLAQLKACRRELIDPGIARHRGRIVKTTGDGLLVEFSSPVEAVRWAVETQQGMIERNADVADDRRIRFRVGINLGDVIVDDKDLYGDAVNIAARLENLADPGGICISATVRDQIRDRLALPFEDSGEQSVKNIARPIRVYALSADAVAALPTAESPTAPRLAGPRYARRNVGAIAVAGMLIIAGGGWWLWSSAKAPSTTATATPAAPSAARRLSIVVLPFSNLGHDPAQQYFVDGITEDLTTDLSRIEGSFVISRNTAFTYKDKPVNAKQIGRELGVGYVLEGSVQRSGQQVRINAQLIDAETDAHLWAERFERDTTDLFALQNEITGRIAVALNFTMIGAEAAQPTANPDAQDYIFRARAAGLKGFSRDNFAEQIGARSAFRRGAELVGDDADEPRAGRSGRFARGRHRPCGRSRQGGVGGIAAQPGCASCQRPAAARAGPIRGGDCRIRKGARAQSQLDGRAVCPRHRQALRRGDRGGNPARGAGNPPQPPRFRSRQRVCSDRAGASAAIAQRRGDRLARKGARRQSEGPLRACLARRGLWP
jgi:TolB-like protein/class 3 adenylate cyclase